MAPAELAIESRLADGCDRLPNFFQERNAMSQSRDAAPAEPVRQPLTAAEILQVQEFVRKIGGIEQARKATEILGKNAKAA